MDEIVSITNKHKIHLIEDCAQAHGATYQNKKIGTFGVIGCFSFYPTKNIGAYGDAGCVVTDRTDLADKIRLFRNYGSKKKYYHDVPGLNTRLDEIQAGLLNLKIDLYPRLLQKRLQLAELYASKIDNQFINLPHINRNCKHVYHLFVIQTQNRDQLQKYLNDHGITTIIHYPIPPHLTNAYQSLGYKKGDFPITEKQATQILSLPLFDYMTVKEANYVIKIINQYSG
jgi:dTDP-4-amino-4,6-dideoxygalactose transaminase